MSGEITQISFKDIRGRVEAFRDVLGPDFKHPPLDAVYIADVVLRLDFIPLEDLWKDLSIDAALTPDLKGLYVDKETFTIMEDTSKNIPWRENRLRFSIAHEIGHYELHGDIIRNLKFNDYKEYVAWVRKRQTEVSPEYQADEFAGQLLVPCEVLLREYDRIKVEVSNRHPDWRKEPGTRQRVAESLAPRFGVNYQVIEKRFDRENIWPAE